MHPKTQKKIDDATARERETWTFQPAEDVRRAVALQYGDIRAKRGMIADLCNNAIRHYIPSAVKAVLEEDHRAKVEQLTNSKPPSVEAAKFAGLAEKALSRERPSRRRKP